MAHFQNMSARQLEPGEFCWVDVAVSDPITTHKFFSELFGWGRRVRPTEEAQAYSIMTLNGHHVAGICEVEEAGPSQWMCYLLVDDLGRWTEQAKRLGATILKDRVVIETFGHMAVVEDPTGAVFALWESLRGEDDEPQGPGSVCWHELVTSDLDRATEFYQKLAGWTYRDTRFGDLAYRQFLQSGRKVCGMMGAQEGRGSAWTVHFEVEDCPQSTTLALTLGAKELRSPYDLENVGQVAYLADPCGGTFGLVRLLEDNTLTR